MTDSSEADVREVSKSGGVQVLARMAVILRLLAEARDGLSLSRLASLAGLPRTTVHRICRALVEEDFVTVEPASGRLHPGPGLVRLAISGHRDVRVVAASYLVALSRELNETVDLAVLDGAEVLFVAHYPAPLQRLMAVSHLGARFPAHCTANGKALLAQLPAEDLRRLLPARLKVPGRQAFTPRESLLRELEAVRSSGLSFDREEHRQGICAVGVALIDADGSLASVSVPMPANRFYADQNVVAAALLRTRNEIQARLNGD